MVEQEENAPELYEISGVTQQDVMAAIKSAIKISGLIKPHKRTLTAVYNILMRMYVDDIPHVIIAAPTGSGKTIIGLLTHFAAQYLWYMKNSPSKCADRPEPLTAFSYNLTPAKALQEQLCNDVERFSLHNYISPLKGGSNYKCLNPAAETYIDRPCKNMSAENRAKHYSVCLDKCPYELARYKASCSNMTSMNYAYFLSAMRIPLRPYFDVRHLTICDEAHLLPKTITSMFNTEFTYSLANRLHNFILSVQSTLRNAVSEFGNFQSYVIELMPLFKYKQPELAAFQDYLTTADKILELLRQFSLNNDIMSVFGKNIESLVDDVAALTEKKDVIADLSTRPEDYLCQSDWSETDKRWKHTVCDLSESFMARRNFLNNTHKTLHMSATINGEAYAEIMGIKKGEYSCFEIESDFDFTNSPIYLCNTGFLNYNTFSANIGNTISKIHQACERDYPNYKGVMHTATNKITELVKEYLQRFAKDKDRYLFYSNSKEKEEKIELLRTSNKPLIICGPSLIEGVDLKDDQGRLNIIVKTPYAAMSDYTKAKMKRYPNWYKQDVHEKLKQMVGRTNRHKFDWSITLCFDSQIEREIFEAMDFDKHQRIRYHKIK